MHRRAKKTGTGMRMQIKSYGTNQNFNAGPSTSVTMRTIQRNIIHMGFWSQRPPRVPLLTARRKALRLA
ncbi:hypothetical protein TNCV_2417061 [Trichonephila clavipes]|nr:hypothetical protein TNCV_2417061 [Trichonephila clavipes]